MPRPRTHPSTALRLIAFVAVVAAISLARTVLLPIAVAILLAFALAPIVRWLEKPLKNRGLAIGATIVLTCSAVLGLLAIGANEAADFVENSPQYREVLQQRMNSTRAGAAAISRLLRDVESATELPPPPEIESDFVGPPLPPSLAESQDVPTAGRSTAPKTGSSAMSLIDIVSAVMHGAAVALLTALLLTVVLVYREDLRDRLVRILGVDSLPLTQKTLSDASERISRYLLTQAALNALFGVLIGVGLFLIGVPSAALLGMVAGLLRFIPYLGTLTATCLGLLTAVATSPDWTTPLLALVIYAIVEGLMAFVLEPWLYGKGAGLSLFGVVVAISFWGWLWGIPGLLVAVPLTACVVLLARHFPALEPLSFLLGDTPPLTPADRFHHRLLSGDVAGARAAVHDHCAACEASDHAIDDFWLTSLRRAAAEVADSRIHDRDLDAYFKTGRELLAHGDQSADIAGPETDRVVIICASNRLDRLGAEVLRSVVHRRSTAHAEIVEAPLMLADLASQERVQSARGIAVVSITRASRRWARLVARAFHQRLPDHPIVLAAFGRQRAASHAATLSGVVRATSVEDVMRTLHVRPRPPAALAPDASAIRKDTPPTSDAQIASDPSLRPA